MDSQKNTKLKLTELFDSESTFKRNVYGDDEQYREMTKDKVIMWNPEYKVAFEYIFHHYTDPDKTLIHVYPYDEKREHREYRQLPDNIRVKIFFDALKKLPKVLKNYFKKFGKINTIVFRPATEQLGRIYTSDQIIGRLKSEFGSDYDIDINKQSHEDWIETGDRQISPNSIIMKLKNTEEPNNVDLQENIQRIKDMMGINENIDDWFGNSEVVDKKGEPLLVYHFTNKEFNDFDLNKPISKILNIKKIN